MRIFLTKEDINEIFRAVKPLFKNQLGKYTHQRISGEWHFHGLGFVKDEMTYVFGINVGFYKKEGSADYDTVGMNVLVRSNGIEPELRKKYADFFRNNLKDWYTEINKYTSFRGGEGDELARYRPIAEFADNAEIIQFLHDSINKISDVYPKIIENPDNIFDDVVKATFPWIDNILEVCQEVIENKAN